MAAAAGKRAFAGGGPRRDGPPIWAVLEADSEASKTTGGDEQQQGFGWYLFPGFITWTLPMGLPDTSLGTASPDCPQAGVVDWSCQTGRVWDRAIPTEVGQDPNVRLSQFGTPGVPGPNVQVT